MSILSILNTILFSIDVVTVAEGIFYTKGEKTNSREMEFTVPQHGVVGDWSNDQNQSSDFHSEQKSEYRSCTGQAAALVSRVLTTVTM